MNILETVYLSQIITDAQEVYKTFQKELERRRNKLPVRKNYIWVDKKGKEKSIHKMRASEIRSIMNLLVEVYNNYLEEVARLGNI